MNKLRILSLILASPFWLIVGVIVGCISIILIVITLFVAICEYGFTGRWDWL